MDTPMGRSGSLFNRFALVIVAVIGIGVVAPITATAATAYFSQVTTAKLTFSAWDLAWQRGQPKTVWCPIGSKVTSGGVYGHEVWVTLDASWPVTNGSGRQGWSVTGDDPFEEDGATTTIFAQCIK